MHRSEVAAEPQAGELRGDRGSHGNGGLVGGPKQVACDCRAPGSARKSEAPDAKPAMQVAVGWRVRRRRQQVQSTQELAVMS